MKECNNCEHIVMTEGERWCSKLDIDFPHSGIDLSENCKHYKETEV